MRCILILLQISNTGSIVTLTTFRGSEKAVYGLRNAPLRWHQLLSKALHEAGSSADGFVHLSFAFFSVCDVPSRLRAGICESHVQQTRNRGLEIMSMTSSESSFVGCDQNWNLARGTKPVSLPWSRVGAETATTVQRRSPFRKLQVRWCL